MRDFYEFKTLLDDTARDLNPGITNGWRAARLVSIQDGSRNPEPVSI